MVKIRTAIPAKIKEEVLKEFRHRCSMCGGDSPQLHHIDENPSNNDPSNLLPLCPNCHLKDQHDPTSNIEVGKLLLFRKYKDPTILKSQFHPLYSRIKFIYEICENDDVETLRKKANELTEFVAALKMGEFYSKQLFKIIGEPPRAYVTALGGGYDPVYEKKKAADNLKYVQQLQRAKNAVNDLIVELLRYQDW